MNDWERGALTLLWLAKGKRSRSDDLPVCICGHSMADHARHGASPCLVRSCSCRAWWLSKADSGPMCDTNEEAGRNPLPGRPPAG